MPYVVRKDNYPNQDIRETIRIHGLTFWLVASELGISEITLSRWLREEPLSENKRKVIESAVRNLCEKRSQNEQ